MDRFYVFLIRNDVWIYILSLLGLVWYLSQLVSARRILKSAMFGLEREKGQRIQRRAITLIILFILTISVVTYVNLQVAPTLPQEILKPPTPTPNIFTTPLSSPTPIAQSSSTPVIAPTVTLPNQTSGPGITTPNNETQPGQEPTIELLSPTPPAPIGNCSQEVFISAPPSGVGVSGPITIFGTASGENFGSYYLEIIGPQTTGIWEIVPDSQRSSSVVDGILGSVDISGWVSGLYTIRIVVNDQAETDIGQCAIQVSIESDGS